MPKEVPARTQGLLEIFLAGVISVCVGLGGVVLVGMVGRGLFEVFMVGFNLFGWG